MLKKILYKLKAPCNKCPYKLGIIQTPVNPCPQCKLNNYQKYDILKEQQIGKYSSNKIQ